MTRGDKRNFGRFAIIGGIAAAVAGIVIAFSFYMSPRGEVEPDIDNSGPSSPEAGEQELTERTPGRLIPTAITVDPEVSLAGSAATDESNKSASTTYP